MGGSQPLAKAARTAQRRCQSRVGNLSLSPRRVYITLASASLSLCTGWEGLLLSQVSALAGPGDRMEGGLTSTSSWPWQGTAGSWLQAPISHGAGALTCLTQPQIRGAHAGSLTLHNGLRTPTGWTQLAACSGGKDTCELTQQLQELPSKSTGGGGPSRATWARQSLAHSNARLPMHTNRRKTSVTASTASHQRTVLMNSRGSKRSEVSPP